MGGESGRAAGSGCGGVDLLDDRAGRHAGAARRQVGQRDDGTVMHLDHQVSARDVGEGLVQRDLRVGGPADEVRTLAEFAHRAERVDEADRAFDAGEHARALGLYEAVLAAEPDHTHALVRSAMLLSWQREFDEALDRYERCLELEPDNEKALLERAKVMSWDRRYDKASEAFRSMLEIDPDHREARLGLARCLSWSGQQTPETTATQARKGMSDGHGCRGRGQSPAPAPSKAPRTPRGSPERRIDEDAWTLPEMSPMARVFRPDPGIRAPLF